MYALPFLFFLFFWWDGQQPISPNAAEVSPELPFSYVNEFIVAGGCGCAGECVVYEEEDRFECLCSNYTPTSSDCDRSDSDCFYDEYHYYYSGDGVCHCPNDTRLAPDLRDCYHSENNLLSSHVIYIV